MSSISRQESGTASLKDEELCGAWPAMAKHMFHPSCRLLLIVNDTRTLPSCLHPPLTLQSSLVCVSYSLVSLDNRVLNCNVLSNLDSFDLKHLSKTACHKGAAPAWYQSSRLVLETVLSSGSEQRSTGGTRLGYTGYLTTSSLLLSLSDCFEGSEIGLNRRPFCNFNQDLEFLSHCPAQFSPPQ